MARRFTTTDDRGDDPEDQADFVPQRVIPEGKVWMFNFESCHAPHFVIQHANGTFSGIYAHVEIAPGDNAVPFGLPYEKVMKQKHQDHVEVTEMDRENSPWADGVYVEGDV